MTCGRRCEIINISTLKNVFSSRRGGGILIECGSPVNIDKNLIESVGDLFYCRIHGMFTQVQRFSVLRASSKIDRCIRLRGLDYIL
ncbi:MAG: hypothetical protein LBT46_09565 [Planctomycetaceae bacterium]|nr:hypothetical protein [Planctomycetaceae bacterium]